MKDPALDPPHTTTPVSKSKSSSRTSPPTATATATATVASSGVKSNSSTATMSSSSSSVPGPSRTVKRPTSPMEKPKPLSSKDQPPVQASTTSTTPSGSTATINDKNRPRTLNRVPRACNACRKQKMRCEGADNPPCKRCRHAGYDCLFEKPVRDVTTSEQGMERIRNLETQVTSINNTLTELVSTLRAGPSFSFQAAPAPGGGNANGGTPAPAQESATPYAHRGAPHHQQPSRGQQPGAIPGSPQTAADSPGSSTGTHPQGPPSHTASAPTPSPRFGPEGVPVGTGAGAGTVSATTQPPHPPGTAAGGQVPSAGGVSTMSPLAIDTVDVNGRAYDQGASGSTAAAYMNGHPPGSSNSATAYPPYGAPGQGSVSMHAAGGGGHRGSAYDSHSHLHGPLSQSPTTMHHGVGGGGGGHPPGPSSSDREYASMPYSPTDESVVGSPTAYRQGSSSISTGSAGPYPSPHHQPHQQYVHHHHHAQGGGSHPLQSHIMGPPQNGPSLPPISTLPSPVQTAYPAPSSSSSSSRSNSVYQQQQYVQTPTTAGSTSTSTRGYSSSTTTTLSSSSPYSGTPHPQGGPSYHQQQQQAYPPQRGSYSYDPTGAGPAGSSQGQEYARPRPIPMHHYDLPTTSNTSPLRRVIPPSSPTSYSHSSQSHSHSHEHEQQQHASSSKSLNPARRALAPSNVTSLESSDDEDGGELPGEGLVAPFKVLRELADWAGADARPETNGGDGASTSHTRSPSPDPQSSRSLCATSSAECGPGTVGIKRESREQGGRRSKRRKILPYPGGQLSTTPHGQVYPDVVTVGIINEQEARELFEIFYHGCSTFLPVFDAKVDTYDVLHRRSPFCVNAICMVAAKVKNGGNQESETYRRILEEVQKIAMATMFSPVTRQEAVQATVIIAGWSTDGGWLSLGHAVRMAFEIGMHKTWPKLLKKIKSGKMSDDEEDRILVISTRTWFCLYLFEHQLSLGTGRPMILHEDESIKDCELFLRHPLAIPDDIRLVSMVQLGVIKERLHKALTHSPLDASPTPLDVYAILENHRGDFDDWTARWDTEFVQRGDEYPDCEFQRQSLEVQRMFAELFHNATALRGIRGPEDVEEMPEEQRLLALRSIDLAKRGLETCLRSPNYRNGLKYAVHFTHVSATFAGSFLIRLARLFPDNVDLRKVMLDVEELILALSSIPATRYARTLRLMLTRARQRNILPARSLPCGPVDGPENGGPPPAQAPEHVIALQADALPAANPIHPQPMETEGGDHTLHHQQALMPPTGPPPPYSGWRSPSSSVPPFDAQIAVGYEQQPYGGAHWNVTDAMLSDLALSQYGLEAFVIPPWDNESHRNIPQIW